MDFIAKYALYISLVVINSRALKKKKERNPALVWECIKRFTTEQPLCRESAHRAVYLACPASVLHRVYVGKKQALSSLHQAVSTGPPRLWFSNPWVANTSAEGRPRPRISSGEVWIQVCYLFLLHPRSWVDKCNQSLSSAPSPQCPQLDFSPSDFTEVLGSPLQKRGVGVRKSGGPGPAPPKHCLKLWQSARQLIK